MNIEWKAVQGTIVGLILGSIIGAVAVIKFPNEPKEEIKLTKSITAESNSAQITAISYKDGRCSLTKDVMKWPSSWSTADSVSIRFGGGYQCSYLDSKKDIETLKKALDIVSELEWVK